MEEVALADHQDPAFHDEEVEAGSGTQASVEEQTAEVEAQTVAARKKELKGMSAEDLKALLSQDGLEPGKKVSMVEALVAHEATARASARERAASLRAAVVEKKSELEGLGLPNLKELCVAHGIRGILTKQARVEQLLEQWLGDNGVEKVLAKKARDSREAALNALDKQALLTLCEKSGVDPFVSEVMIERIVRQEGADGLFERPVLDIADDVVEAKELPLLLPADIVEALLAKEASRKKERELQQLREEASANKRKELAALTIEALKKQLASKGAEAIGKKEDMVESLFAISQQEDAVLARRVKLTSMDVDDLKKLCALRNLESCKKSGMVDALLAHEEKKRQEIHAYEKKLVEALGKREEELLAKSGAELKELCASKGLKSSSSKEDLVKRLVEMAKLDGSADQLVASMVCTARREALRALTTAALHALCRQRGVDALVKEVMVERILASELEEPPAKRRRV